MAQVIVVGAGICGLGTALLLARDGHEVTVLERDDRPVPGAAREAWDAWQRKGVAQFRQPHNFMPGLRAILEQAASRSASSMASRCAMCCARPATIRMRSSCASTR